MGARSSHLWTLRERSAGWKQKNADRAKPLHGICWRLSDLKVPVLSVVIGEGGSGGALALAVGNEVWMMENATYTILSPEGFASILWKDSRKASEAAEVMKVTAAHLKELGIIERIIPEEYPASQENLPEIAEYMKIRMKQFLSETGW